MERIAIGLDHVDLLQKGAVLLWKEAEKVKLVIVGSGIVRHRHILVMPIDESPHMEEALVDSLFIPIRHELETLLPRTVSEVGSGGAKN